MIIKIKRILFLFSLTLLSLTSWGSIRDELKQADSLFDAQQYTEAYELYEKLFEQGVASSSMLLKMASIQDGSKNYADALFFLDTYFQRSADRSVIGKIESIAGEHELQGYAYDDGRYFLALLKKYRWYLAALLVVLALVLLLYTFRKKQQEDVLWPSLIIQGVLLIATLALVNIRPSPEAIIYRQKALLRTGPSAGAEPSDFLSKGHKVKVLSRGDVWSKISWEGQELYIRNALLKTI